MLFYQRVPLNPPFYANPHMPHGWKISAEKNPSKYQPPRLKLILSAVSCTSDILQYSKVKVRTDIQFKIGVCVCVYVYIYIIL